MKREKTTFSLPPYKEALSWLKETDPAIYNAQKEWPLVSIIMPSLNQGEFIEASIRSILLQNYPNLEFIIIDGGSNDNTLKVIEKYDSWISYWESVPDKGQAQALNKGFKIGSGEIATWINSDDLLFPSALFKVVNWFKNNPGMDFVYGLSYVLTPDNKVALNKNNNTTAELEYEYLASFPYSQPSCFFTYDILGRVGFLDESYDITMDYDLFVRMSLNGEMYGISEMIGVFRVHGKAKTYAYTLAWDLDRKRVFSTLLRTIKANSNWLDILENCSLYIPGKSIYSSQKEFSENQIKRIIQIFIRDHIKLNFFAERFQTVFSISYGLRRLYPDFFLSSLNLYYYKSSFYRYPVLFAISRPMAFLWRKIRAYINKLSSKDN